MPRSWTLPSLPVLLFLTMLAAPAAAQAAGPTDVYWSVHRVHKFQIYAFPADTLPWEHARFAGFDLNVASTHDTGTVNGPVSMRTDLVAGSGVLTADLATIAEIAAQRGLYHLLTNTLEIKAYVRGAPGTPCLVERVRAGRGLAWRLGGLPGGLQPVNGTSRATFADSSAYVPDGGVDSTALADSVVIPLLSTADTIRVNGELYSAVYGNSLLMPVHLTQAVCILGCMTAAANFLGEATGTLRIEVTPSVNPVSVPVGAPVPIALSAAPNPVRGTGTVTFTALAGERASVAVFDPAGRCVARLWDGPATGAPQRLAWHPAGARPGVYLVRAESGGRATTAKVVVAE